MVLLPAIALSSFMSIPGAGDADAGIVTETAAIGRIPALGMFGDAAGLDADTPDAVAGRLPIVFADPFQSQSLSISSSSGLQEDPMTHPADEHPHAGATARVDPLPLNLIGRTDTTSSSLMYLHAHETLNSCIQEGYFIRPETGD